MPRSTTGASPIGVTTVEVSSLQDFRARFSGDGERGFVYCFAADVPDYAAVLEELKVSARCIPLGDDRRGTCIFTGKPDARGVLFAQAY